MRYVFRFWFALALSLALMAGCSDDGESSTDSILWVASSALVSEEEPGHVGFGITVSSSDGSEVQWLTDGELDDYKPAYSPDVSKIAFFRLLDLGRGEVVLWSPKFMVMRPDGSGVRELTDSGGLDHIPYWTRDGSGDIIFNRTYGAGQSIYRTSPDAQPGDEQLLSDPSYIEEGYSSLRDGRVIIRRDFPPKVFLLTPGDSGSPRYEEVSYPFEGALLHRITLSPSETKIAYMKIAPENLDPEDYLHVYIYNPSVIAHADFDAENLRIGNEVEITQYDESTRDWYPAWSADEKLIVWTHGVSCSVLGTEPCEPSGVVMAYSLETGVTTQISSRDDLEYRYPNVVGTVK